MEPEKPSHRKSDRPTALPYHITRHAHPKARPEAPGSGDDAPRATGIDYLALLDAQHNRQLAGRVNYAALGGDGGQPGHGQQQQQQGNKEQGK